MTLIILERVPAPVRGELTKWLLEPRTGVFLGDVSSAVRERLWQCACERLGGGAGVLAYSAGGEPGYAMRFWGNPSRVVLDFDGLPLVQILEK